MKAKLPGIVFLSAVLSCTALTIFGLAPAANAKTLDLPGDAFGLRIVQSPTGGDTLQYFGLDGLTAFNNTASSSTLDGSSPDFGSSDGVGGFGSNSASGLYEYADERPLFQGIENALGLDVAKVRYSETPDATDGGDYPDTEVSVNTHQNLFVNRGGTFTLNVDAGAVANAADTYNIDQLGFGVCPLKIAAADVSTQPADAIDNSTGCHWWLDSSALANQNFVFKESPASAPYWHFLGWVIFSVLIATIVLMIGTWFLRGRWKTLGTGNLVLACVGSFLAWLSALCALVAIYDAAHSLDEYALASNLTDGGHLMAAALPALLFMVPFLLPVVMLITVPVAPYAPKTQPTYQPMQPMPGAPGAPSWLGGPGAPPTGGAQWQPTQAQTQQWPAPPGWQPAPPPVLGKNQWRPDNAASVPPGQWAAQSPPPASTPAPEPQPPSQPDAPVPEPQQPELQQPELQQPELQQPELQDEPPPHTWHPPA